LSGFKVSADKWREAETAAEAAVNAHILFWDVC
jgi:hypothetical protein